MSKDFKNKTGQKIILSDKPIANPGGEGAIYDVLNDKDIDVVAKIYHTEEMAQNRQGKLEFMVANSPIKEADPAVQNAIVWPIECVYDKKGKFVGFTMPKIENAITLKSLTLPQNPSKKHGKAWQKFDYDQKGAHQKRLAVAYNLANAVHTIHQSGNYVLVDLKPENIFIKPNGNIAIIDLDSIQINNPDIRFPAKVYTEEFAPPELHRKQVNHTNGNIEDEWDYFSLAVIIYQLLFGIHPFQASHKNLTTLPDLIKNGFFVHGKKAKQLHVIPKLHLNFKKLDNGLQALFVRTFEEGKQEINKRASGQEWTNTILPILNEPATLNIQIQSIPKKQKSKNKARIVHPNKVNNTQKTNSQKKKDEPWVTFVIIIILLFSIFLVHWVDSLVHLRIQSLFGSLSLFFGLSAMCLAGAYYSSSDSFWKKGGLYSMGISLCCLLIWYSIGTYKSYIGNQSQNKKELPIHATKTEITRLPNGFTRYGRSVYEDVYSEVEKMPFFHYSQNQLNNFVLEKAKELLLNKWEDIKHTKESDLANSDLKLSFIVDQEGALTQCRIIKYSSIFNEDESLDFVRSMPNWVPGSQDGENVKVLMELHIERKLIVDAWYKAKKQMRNQ